LAIQREAARSRICFGPIDGCSSKSKLASSFTAGKCASFQRHLDATVILALDLTLAQKDQRLTRRQVRARRLVEQVVELIANAGELHVAPTWRLADRLVVRLLSSPVPSEAPSNRCFMFGKRTQQRGRWR
jgi:hypothetical protein